MNPTACDPDASLLQAFGRHLDRCNSARLPGGRRRLLLAGAPIGYVAGAALADPVLGRFLRPGPDDAHAAIDDLATLDRAARALADAGRVRWRDEAFDVRRDDTGEIVGALDRGALPDFGIAATGVHLNGLVESQAGPLLWVARRAADKLLDPGKLDHLAAGGVPAGLGVRETLLKEAAEECGLAPALLADAVAVTTIRYAMDRPEGLRRDTLRCFDVVLPASWEPEALDGEVESFELWPLSRVFETVQDGDAFKFNVNLVLIDLFLRRGLIDRQSRGGRRLADGLEGTWQGRCP